MYNNLSILLLSLAISIPSLGLLTPLFALPFINKISPISFWTLPRWTKLWVGRVRTLLNQGRKYLKGRVEIVDLPTPTSNNLIWWWLNTQSLKRRNQWFHFNLHPITRGLRVQGTRRCCRGKGWKVHPRSYQTTLRRRSRGRGWHPWRTYHQLSPTFLSLIVKISIIFKVFLVSVETV